MLKVAKRVQLSLSADEHGRGLKRCFDDEDALSPTVQPNSSRSTPAGTTSKPRLRTKRRACGPAALHYCKDQGLPLITDWRLVAVQVDSCSRLTLCGRVYVRRT